MSESEGHYQEFCDDDRPEGWANMQQALFDAHEATLQKELGMARAEANRAEALEWAQRAAFTIAVRNGTVCIDDVYILMDAFGGHPERLGNAAGSVFDKRRFEFTGRWVKSKRVSNHGRWIRVWRLK